MRNYYKFDYLKPSEEIKSLVKLDINNLGIVKTLDSKGDYSDTSYKILIYLVSNYNIFCSPNIKSKVYNWILEKEISYIGDKIINIGNLNYEHKILDRIIEHSDKIHIYYHHKTDSINELIFITLRDSKFDILIDE